MTLYRFIAMFIVVSDDSSERYTCIAEYKKQTERFGSRAFVSCTDFELVFCYVYCSLESSDIIVMIFMQYECSG